MEALDFHDILFFFSSDMADFFNVLVGEFLQVFFGALQFILRNQLFLLEFAQILDRIAANVANGIPVLFEPVMNHFHQVTAAFFCQGGQVQADGFSIVVGVQAQV